ncbi:Gfo/Idh/MocA family protein [Coprothermobacter platensis]|uniref:Gfo/Idh/MocA family protein n=1 Tax=Coprothermobacter platensis TaxID=108819 RepID=UPI00035C4A6C|nr:Gfo/Idh/MocA family oxidoreductase [Coprothermobacter platensis]
MDSMIRVGIIGCGGIAFAKHMPFLSQTDGVEIAGFYNPTEEKARRAKKEFGSKDAKIYKSWQELLEDPSIDVVHVLTPNKFHAEMSIAALEAGKHVMCEKPMATNVADAKRMIEAAKISGKKLTIAFQNRFRPENMMLKNIVERGDLGQIYFAKARALRRRGVPTWGNFLNKDMQGGGALIDIGSHALDLTLWLMNNYQVKTVTGTTYGVLAKQEDAANPWGPWDPGKFEVEESAFGFVTMADGATVVVESSWALNILDEGEAQTVLCGSKAGADNMHGLRINGEDMGSLYLKTVETDLHGAAYYESKPADPGELEIRSWIEAIKDDKEPLVQPEQAFAVTQIIDAIYTSAQTGKAISF